MRVGWNTSPLGLKQRLNKLALSPARAHKTYSPEREIAPAISAARLLLAQPLTMTMRYTRCQVLAQIASFLGMLQQCFRDGSVA